VSKLLVGSATDVGLVRSNNQDQLLVAPGLYAVADGMGGHAAGEVASYTAIRALQAAFNASDQHSTESLESAAKAANRAVWEQARTNRGMLGMGTTLVALAVVEKTDGTNGLAVAHIGDSRLYLYRDQLLSQLTIDHSLVQELVDDGQISVAQAAVHPQRHVLTRALGVEPSVDVDLLDITPKHGDRYLLCSDGLPREASDDQIAAVMARFADPTEAARELVDLANSRGGSDNTTVVVVDVLANDSSPDTLIVVPGPASSGPTGPVRRPEGTAVTGDALDDGGRLNTRGTTTVYNGPGPDQALPAPGGEPGRARSRRTPSPRRVTWRVAGFVLAVGVVVGGTLACLAWYARSAYFVTISDGRITVFQGRPGGLLWFKPTLSKRTALTSSSVPAYYLPALQAGQIEPSLAQADMYIARMVVEKREAEAVTPPSARGAPHPRPAPSTTTGAGPRRSPHRTTTTGAGLGGKGKTPVITATKRGAAT
jgi:serine/threonine protein phosphatase PrpC